MQSLTLQCHLHSVGSVGIPMSVGILSCHAQCGFSAVLQMYCVLQCDGWKLNMISRVMLFEAIAVCLQDCGKIVHLQDAKPVDCDKTACLKIVYR